MGVHRPFIPPPPFVKPTLGLTYIYLRASFRYINTSGASTKACSQRKRGVTTLYVEYAERRSEYGILFTFSLFCEYLNLEYVRVPVIYMNNKAEYQIHIIVAASQKYVNTYSTRRFTTG